MPAPRQGHFENQRSAPRNLFTVLTLGELQETEGNLRLEARRPLFFCICFLVYFEEFLKKKL